MPTLRTPDRVSGAIVLLAAVGVICFLVLISGRGLDITDEGYYLLSARHPEDIVFSVSSEYYYTHALFRLVGYDVIGFRRLGLLALVASSLVLAVGVARLAARIEGVERPDYAGFAGLTILGSLLYYGWFLPTPSYNLLNAVVVNCALGLFLGSLAPAAGRGGPRRRAAELLLVFAAGAVLGAGTFVKITTALAVLGGLAVLCALWPRPSTRGLLRLWSALLLGFVAWLAMDFLVVKPLPAWLERTRMGLSALHVMDPGRDLAAMLSQNISGLKRLVGDVLAANWHLFLASGAVAAWVRGRRAPSASIRVAAGSVAILAVAAGLFWIRDLHLAGADRLHHVVRFHLAALCLLALTALAVGAAGSREARAGPQAYRRTLLAATLLLLPLAFSLGTKNDIGSFSALFLGPWFALYAWLGSTLACTVPGRWVARAATVLVVAFTCSQVVSGSWSRPYRLNGTLGDQTVATVVGAPPSVLHLDPPTSAFLDRVRATLGANGFRPGGDILGLFGVQGVVYAVGGRSLGLAWYSGDYPGSRAYTDRALALVPRARLRRAFLLLTSESGRALPRLADHGLDFPERYELCGELDIPYPWTGESLQIWRPLAVSQGS